MTSLHDDPHVTATLKRKREDFLHGLGITDQLLLSYEELLSNAGLNIDLGSSQTVGSSVARQNLQLQIHTSLIATQAESLLKLLSELRYNLLFADLDTTTREVNDNIAKCRKIGVETQEVLSIIQSGLEGTISDIEAALLPHTALPDEQ